MSSYMLKISEISNDQSYSLSEKARLLNNHLTALENDEMIFFNRISLNGSSYSRLVFDRYSNKKEMIYLASNDYLNLTQHPRVISSAINAIKQYGTGAGSAPLFGGAIDKHVELEQKIAKLKGCEAALIYTSGFGTNYGTISALLHEKDVAILDMYVHASIIDGCKNTNTKFFKHNDIDSLEKVLRNAKDKYNTKLIIVDGVFSMDGDIARLDKIVELAKLYSAYVMVDEAHATGIIGENGRGTPEYFNIEGKVDIVAGTFSKALGGVGGFVAATNDIIKFLKFNSRSYIFSTALPPSIACSAIESINIIETEPIHRKKLWQNIEYFRSNLLKMGFNIGNSQTAIFPIIIGDEYKVMSMNRELNKENIFVNAAFYPAVPRRLSRIRMSLMSTNTTDQLDRVFDILETLGKKYGVIG